MFLNLKSIQKKLLISLIIITLTCSNFILVGSNLYKGLISYAVDGIEVKDEDYSSKEDTTPTPSVVITPVTVTDIDVEPGTIGEITPVPEPIDTQSTGTQTPTETEIIATDPQEVQDETEQFVCEVSLESKDLHKTKMEEETEYVEQLNLHLLRVQNVTIKDVMHNFFDNEEIETENAKLKYVKTTMNKEDLIDLLGTEGKLTIKDEENILAELSKEYIEKLEIDEKTPIVFTIMVEKENDEGEIVEEEQEEIRAYITVSGENVEIEYLLEVEDITLTIDNISLEDEENNIKEFNFVIENTKSIFDVLDLENLNYLKENVDFTYNDTEEAEEIEEDNELEEIVENEEETDEPESDIVNIIKFKDTTTRAYLETTTEQITLGTTNIIDYKITLDTTSPKSEVFVNPIFVLELPENIESVNAENSKFKVVNDEGAFTGKKVSLVNLLGRKYVIVMLEGEQTEDTIVNGNAYITISLEVNVKDGEETAATTKLFYQNDMVTAYESGLGFDTDEVDIPTILEVEDIESINEEIEEDNNEEENVQEVNENTVSYLKMFLQDGKYDNRVRVGEEFEYFVYIDNYENNFENATIEDEIPEGLEFIGTSLFGVDDNYNYQREIDVREIIQYNSDTRVLKFEITRVEEGALLLKIKVKANSLKENEYSKAINNRIKIVRDSNIIQKEELSVDVSDSFLSTTISDIQKDIEVGQTVQCEINLKNLGLFKAVKTIDIEIPDELAPGTISIQNTSNDYYTTIPMEEHNKDIEVIMYGENNYNISITASYYDALEEDTTVKIMATIDDQKYEWTTKLLKDEQITPKIEEIEENETDKPEENTENEQNPKQTEENDFVNDMENSSQSEAIFDLSLNQSLKKITVTNNSGTKVYEYKDDIDFAKVEIPRKEMNGTSVTLEYEVSIKNEGTIEGYARKIVDYIPKGLNFNSELNTDWYIGDDGNIYSVALIEKLLKPGETATLSIVLTKQMTNTNSGTIENVIEICEASNEENIEDINSIPGDKLDGQNDISKVEVLIAVITGEITMYFVLCTLVLIVLICGVIQVKRFMLNKKGGC